MSLKPSVVVGLVAGLCASAARGGAAQEVQVPIDESGRLEVVTAALEAKLRLFSEYPQFREARLFQLADSSFVLEITHEPQGRLTRVRVPMSVEAVRDFRARVSASLQEAAPEAVLDQSGRTKLLVWSTALALLYYGPAAPIILDVDDPQGAVGLYMISASAGFFIPFLATKRIPTTEAGAVLGTYGATRGIIHGTLAAYLFDPDPTEQGFFGAGFLTGITEGIAGFAAANAGRMTPGTAELVGVGSDFGLGYGLGVSHLAGFFDSDYAPVTGVYNDEDEAGFAAVSLLGTAAGAAAGYALSRNQPFTRGDAFVVRNAGFLGAHLGLAVADMFNADDNQDKLYSVLAMTGAGVGLAVGTGLTRGRDFTTAQGTFLTLGHLAGGLVGLGLGVVASDDSDNSVLLLTTSAIGAGLGYGLIYQSFAREAKVAAGNLDLYLNPLALAASVADRPGRRDRPMPVLGASYRF